jgi:hypothetical protein
MSTCSHDMSSRLSLTRSRTPVRVSGFLGQTSTEVARFPSLLSGIIPDKTDPLATGEKDFVQTVISAGDDYDLK